MELSETSCQKILEWAEELLDRQRGKADGTLPDEGTPLKELELAPIVKAFQARLRQENPSLDVEVSFMNVMTDLLSRKSAKLVPEDRESAATDEDEIAPDELLHQLMEFRRYREAAMHLTQRAEDMRRRHSRLPPEIQRWENAFREVEGTDLTDLVSALEELLASDVAYAETIPRETVSVSECMERIRTVLEGSSGSVQFADLFPSRGGRQLFVGIFVALLELIRTSEVRVRQEDRFGEIMVYRNQSKDDEVT